MLKKIALFVLLAFAMPVFAQSTTPKAQTSEELKLELAKKDVEIAQLRQQLIQAQAQLLQFANQENQTALKVKALTVSASGGTLSGCSLTGASGTQTAGSFTSGTTGTCTVTMTVGYVVAHGYACWATDQTSGVTLPQTASTTSSCTFAGNTTSGDIIVYGITGY